MSIISFEYEDLRRGWKLERMELGSFNLLVGLSGAGKTSIITALGKAAAAGLFPTSVHGNYRWAMALASGTQTYCWHVQASMTERELLVSDAQDSLPSRVMRFEQETIETGDGETLVERSRSGFLFLGKSLPRLKETESAISLLKDEDSIAPLHRALQRIFISSHTEEHYRYSLYLPDIEEAERKTGDTLDALREQSYLPPLVKAYIAWRRHPESFARIKASYREIFPGITDLAVGPLHELDPEHKRGGRWSANYVTITVAIKENGMQDWLVPPTISSGMLRTFLHLTELEFSPKGTTIVIDEYENSMGVNCLPALTAHLLQRQGDLQFILTSHHPYVISNVPREWWRVVTRKGGTVRVQNASEIPALNTSSRQDPFTLLINSEVYEEGIQ